MSSPLSPILANHNGSSGIFFLTSHLRYARYVNYIDDTIFVYICDSELNFLFRGLNSFHPNLKFTHELEKSGKFSLLDLLLYRMNNDSELLYTRNHPFLVFIYMPTVRTFLYF